MSESTGPMTISRAPTGCLVRCCGQALPHLEVKIKKPDSDDEGEVSNRFVKREVYRVREPASFHTLAANLTIFIWFRAFFSK